jgi:hypothetical protein
MTDAGTLFGRSMAFPPRLGPGGRWARCEAHAGLPVCVP